MSPGSARRFAGISRRGGATLVSLLLAAGPAWAQDPPEDAKATAAQPGPASREPEKPAAPFAPHRLDDWYRRGLVRFGFGMGYLGASFSPREGDAVHLSGAPFVVMLGGGVPLTSRVALVVRGTWADCPRPSGTFAGRSMGPLDGDVHLLSPQAGAVLVSRASPDVAVLVEATLGPGWALRKEPMARQSQVEQTSSSSLLFGATAGIGAEAFAEDFRLGFMVTLQAYLGGGGAGLTWDQTSPQGAISGPMRVAAFIPCATLTFAVPF